MAKYPDAIGDIKLESLELDKAYYLVYGCECFPKVLCFKLNNPWGSVTIWGHSIYRRSPGFRTLGQTFSKWRSENIMNGYEVYFDHYGAFVNYFQSLFREVNDEGEFT